MRRALPLMLALTAAVGCHSSKSDAVVAAPVTGAAPAAAPATIQPFSGKVLERLEASPYCYLRLQTTRGEVWVAVPEAKVEKGAEVTVSNPMVMNNFESKTLNRTFPEVFFGTLAPAGTVATAALPNTPPVAGPAGTPVSAQVEVGKIDKATGADAHTVADVWAKKGSLKEKTVSIRGKVVKYNAGVMGKNWLHLQDGTGDAGTGTHDITITSKDAAAKGDVVTVKGVLHLDKDFGAGYKYAAIVEDAKVVKQ